VPNLLRNLLTLSLGLVLKALQRILIDKLFRWRTVREVKVVIGVPRKLWEFVRHVVYIYTVGTWRRGGVPLLRKSWDKTGAEGDKAQLGRTGSMPGLSRLLEGKLNKICCCCSWRSADGRMLSWRGRQISRDRNQETDPALCAASLFAASPFAREAAASCMLLDSSITGESCLQEQP